jgi:hypothetical protein
MQIYIVWETLIDHDHEVCPALPASTILYQMLVEMVALPAGLFTTACVHPDGPEKVASLPPQATVAITRLPCVIPDANVTACEVTDPLELTELP